MNDYLDPAIFRADTVSAETVAINAELARQAAAAAPMDLPTLRATFDQGRGPIPATARSSRARTVRIDGGDGHEIALRIISGPAPTGVLLHIHGGMWIMGTADMRDADLERIVENTGLACVSVDYRLAPEYAYPAAQNDCETAAIWLIQNAREQFGTERLTIGGESAGAHLSVTTLLRLRGKGHGSAFRAACLIYGIYDLSMTPSQLAASDTPVLTRQSLEGGIAAYLQGEFDRRQPDVSPLYADLGDLPPALFSVGTADPLLDDSLFMHARWVAAGNRAELALYPGGSHGFTTFQGELAQQANAAIDRFLSRHAEA
jgi:acetyl esterase/lipase